MAFAALSFQPFPFVEWQRDPLRVSKWLPVPTHGLHPASRNLASASRSPAGQWASVPSERKVKGLCLMFRVVFRTDEAPAGQEPCSEQASTARGLAEAGARDGVESGGSWGRDPLRGSCDYY